VEEIILPKNMIGCPLKFNLGFFRTSVFLATINQNIYTQLICMNT